MNITRSVLIVTALLVGCAPPPKKTEPGTPQGELRKSTIGAAGGSVTSADGKAKLTVPAGALSAEVEIGLQALTAVSPGAIGSGWRLTPDGQTFSSPVTLELAFTEEAMSGVPKAAVALATQRKDGVWKLEAVATLDEANKKASGAITHFSDWSLVAGVQMRPGSAKVKVGEPLTLAIAHCFVHPPDEDELTWLSYDCDPSEGELAPLLPLAKTAMWSVNGVEGGSSEFGSVSGADNRGAYKAPSKKPSANEVAVSAEVLLFGAGKTLVVSNVTITDDSASYFGSFSSSLSSADVNYTVTGNVTWEQSGSEKFKPSGAGQVTYTAKCGATTANFSGARAIITTMQGAGELTRFPSLGWYQFSFAFEQFEYMCNGVPVPVTLTMNACDQTGRLMIGSDANVIAGTGTCGPQQLTWSWVRQ